MLLVILDNLKKIQYRIASAAQKAGRNPAEISIVIVTKYAPLDRIREVLSSGLVHEVGENRVQDAAAKKEALGDQAKTVRWRLIGHLQTNKARLAAQTFDAVDSVDSLRVAAALDAACAAQKKTMPVLIQVKLTDKQTQAGAALEEVPELLEGLKAFPNLQARGLMAIAPDLEPVELVRPHFKKMRQAFDLIFAKSPNAQLSMGMSRDFETAVEEGATHLRLGSVVFTEQ